MTDAERAAELAEQGLEHERRREWREAYALLEQSLALHRDPAVEAAWRRVQAVIYPL